MNRDFLSNFEQPAENRNSINPEIPIAENVDDVDFSDYGYIRNVCFVWPDGRRKFIPYSRLDSGEINSENNAILLVFGAQSVELIGLRLLPLFHSFMENKRKFVYCDDARYNDLNDDDMIVNEIVISHYS